MHTPFFRIQSTPDLPSLPAEKTMKTADVIVERITSAYIRDYKENTKVEHWPDPLPTPNTFQPDPLLLFQPGKKTAAQSYLTLVPLTAQEVIVRRHHHSNATMQIPLGLIDLPEDQQRDTLLVDLHGNSHIPQSGPLLILGANNSGKNTILETLLLWLVARSHGTQLKCIIIDPAHKLTSFRHLPHLHDPSGMRLWTDGSNPEELQEITDRMISWSKERLEQHKGITWEADTLTQLYTSGTPLTQFVVIINQYHLFSSRPEETQRLARMISHLIGLRFMGIYLVLTSNTPMMSYLSADTIQKFNTRIHLFLEPGQIKDVSGQYCQMDNIPGRGLLLTKDGHTHQIQSALPVHGPTEKERQENLHALLRSI